MIEHRNLGTPPEEVIRTFRRYQGSRCFTDEQMSILVPAWYSRPALNPPLRRLPFRDLTFRQVDAFAIVEPFLNNPILNQTIRIMDTANGCGHQCNTCFMDSPLPSTLFSLVSLDRLFSTPEFMKMLQPDSFRIGSAGDLLDHPDAVDITAMILERTAPLDAARRTKGANHTLKIFTNYRKIHESALVDLIHLTERAKERIDLTISLPNNRIDTVNLQFKEFAQKHADLFKWKPYKENDHPYWIMGICAHDYPEILKGNPSLEEKNHFTQMVEQRLREVGNKDSRAEIEETVQDYLRFLPEQIRKEGGIKKFRTYLASVAREDADEKKVHPGEINNSYIGIENVRGKKSISIIGRRLPDALLVNRGQIDIAEKSSSVIRDHDFSNRGLCKVFFNPDGLWLQVYATAIESYTAKVYTPISVSNLELLSEIPFHPDFPNPPSWRGGTGHIRPFTAVRREVEEARRLYPEIERKMNIINNPISS